LIAGVAIRELGEHGGRMSNSAGTAIDNEKGSCGHEGGRMSNSAGIAIGHGEGLCAPVRA
jgi:hypothetical protein